VYKTIQAVLAVTGITLGLAVASAQSDGDSKMKMSKMSDKDVMMQVDKMSAQEKATLFDKMSRRRQVDGYQNGRPRYD